MNSPILLFLFLRHEVDKFIFDNGGFLREILFGKEENEGSDERPSGEAQGELQSKVGRLNIRQELRQSKECRSHTAHLSSPWSFLTNTSRPNLEHGPPLRRVSGARKIYVLLLLKIKGSLQTRRSLRQILFRRQRFIRKSCTFFVYVCVWLRRE